VPAARSAAIARALTAWYDLVRRDLPWRRTRDPYAIWVSEIMLQQTRVDTVVPYYQRFMQRFPDARALASAPLDDVLHAWSGLGYYRRARQLHLAASEVVERHAGRVPETVTELSSLSGIGRYTAGAIASIAYDAREPLVDGNVMRVLARLYGIDEDMRAQAGQKRAWAIAAELVPETEPGRFNQALMELGATVCTPRAPSCDRCPLARTCVALREGSVDRLPRLGARRAPTPVRAAAAVVVHRASGRVLLGRRPPDGLYGGMWEPPMVEVGQRIEEHIAVHRAFEFLPRGAHLEQAGEVTHVLSHRRMEIMVLRAVVTRAGRCAKRPSPYVELAWQSPPAVALSTLARKLLRAGEG